MVKTKPSLVFVSCVTSTIAAILSLTALGTEQWIVAEGKFTGELENEKSSEIHYGLFSGVFRSNLLGDSVAYQLTMTCLVGDNICAMLCKTTTEDRTKELEKLANDEAVQFDYTCSQVPKTFKQVTFPGKSNTREGDGNRTFINAGCYYCTVIFLIISAGFGLFAAALSVWNTAANPHQTYLSIFGIYIYNTIAAVSVLIMICVWGIEFLVKLIENVCILHTIVGNMDTNGRAALGYSYWINIGSFFLYLGSIAALFCRQYMIEREPPPREYLEETNEDIILF